MTSPLSDSPAPSRIIPIGLIGFVVLVLACSHAPLDSQGGSQALPSSSRSKLDPPLLHRLDELGGLGEPAQPVSVLIRTTTEISPDQEQQLERLGVTIHSQLGVILSATLPVRSVPDVARLKFITRIELAKQLKKREEQ